MIPASPDLLPPSVGTFQSIRHLARSTLHTSIALLGRHRPARASGVVSSCVRPGASRPVAVSALVFLACFPIHSAGSA